MSRASNLTRATLAPSVLPLPTDITSSLHRPGPQRFEARQFGRHEFKVCLSLKEARHVVVDGVTPIAVARSPECNPNGAAYTKRPVPVPQRVAHGE